MVRIEEITTKALAKIGNDRYKLALVVAKRAQELANGAMPLVELSQDKVKFTDIALYEIAEDKIAIENDIETD